MRRSEPVQATATVSVIGVGVPENVGTAFVAPIYSSDDPHGVFLVTAAHVILEAYRSEWPILVQFDNGVPLAARVIVLDPPRPEGDDIAVLRLEESLNLVHVVCSADALSGPAIIRGAATGLSTTFTTLDGVCNGIEKDRHSGRHMMDIKSVELIDIPGCVDGQPRTSAHDIWAGMSGSPVAQRTADAIERYVVIGMLVRLEPEGRAGRAYAVPIASVHRLCRQHGGLDLELQRQSVLATPESAVELLLVELLQNLEQETNESRAWQMLSNLLFRGYPIDTMLERFINSPAFVAIDRGDAAFTDYFLGRLLLKRGRPKRGVYTINRALRRAETASDIVRKRLNALATARVAVELPSRGSPGSDNSEWKRALLRLENHTREEYLLYEISSLTGVQVMKKFENTNAIRRGASNILSDISTYESLVERGGHFLAKHDVVLTAAKVLAGLWQLAGRESTESVFALTDRGFVQSRKLRNSLFYLQMIMARAVVFYRRGQSARAVAMLMFTIRLLKAAGISLEHEGNFHIMLNIKQLHPELANFMELAMNQPIDASLADIDLDRFQIALSGRQTLESYGVAGDWLESAKWETLYETDPSRFTQ